MPTFEEDHLRSDYARCVKGESRIAPGRVVDHREYMVCPRCGAEQSLIGHGEKRTCSCGLQMECWGNLLRLRFVVDEPVDEQKESDSLPLHEDLLSLLGYIPNEGETPPPQPEPPTPKWHPEEQP